MSDEDRRALTTALILMFPNKRPPKPITEDEAKDIIEAYHQMNTLALIRIRKAIEDAANDLRNSHN